MSTSDGNADSRGEGGKEGREGGDSPPILLRLFGVVFAALFPPKDGRPGFLFLPRGCAVPVRLAVWGFCFWDAIGVFGPFQPILAATRRAH